VNGLSSPKEGAETGEGAEGEGEGPTEGSGVYWGGPGGGAPPSAGGGAEGEGWEEEEEDEGPDSSFFSYSFPLSSVVISPPSSIF